MSERKKKYIQLCQENDIPIFSQYFWLDAVCGEENWDVILIEEQGNILASLPYYLNYIEGGFEIRKAPLTQNNGVFFYYPSKIKYESKISFEHKVLDKVIDEIEKLNISNFRQYFHYSFENWLPFYWRGYTQSTRYTYIIEDTSNIEAIYKKFNGNIRTNIKKADSIVRVYDDLSYEDFYNLNRKTYGRQGLDIPYSFELFERLYQNLDKNGLVKILTAKDEKENIHSAALFAQDSDSVYYLMSGSDQEYRSSQSLTLLIYEGIKLASQHGKKFDFEGSMKKNIEKFFRQFGAVQVPYFDISKVFNKRTGQKND
ncbi:GNAT family N-acetyltransferase [Bacillus sp. FJAT-27251]|uniref:GNAT family N-acetyltransferase n=1 Tax=Bacillus sp. FJAT-27251 TaxID=1684142 RepID=UPI0006A77F63|nr:GNAT family N-acetyltransferase [Bacillus sp. FJAT-27251]